MFLSKKFISRKALFRRDFAEANLRYTEYPGVKHNSWENVSKERPLVEWLFAQKKQ